MFGQFVYPLLIQELLLMAVIEIPCHIYKAFCYSATLHKTDEEQQYVTVEWGAHILVFGYLVNSRKAGKQENRKKGGLGLEEQNKKKKKKRKKNGWGFEFSRFLLMTVFVRLPSFIGFILVSIFIVWKICDHHKYIIYWFGCCCSINSEKVGFEAFVGIYIYIHIQYIHHTCY